MIDFKITVQEDPVLLNLIDQLLSESVGQYMGTNGSDERLPGISEGAIAVLMLLVDIPIGCVVLQPSGFAGIADIHHMYLLPAHRGRGYGRKLVVAIEKVARTLEVETIRCKVSVNQVEMIHLSLSCGYKRVNSDTASEGPLEFVQMEKMLRDRR